MTIITVVEGKIPSSKNAEFEYNFSATKKEPLPEGLVTSTLLRNINEPETYRIQTVWQSKEALQKMRQTTQTPKALELFQKAGAKTTLQVYEAVDSIP